jgi:hypothetical protein
MGEHRQDGVEVADPPVARAALLLGQGFGKEEEAEGGGDQCEAAGDKGGGLEADAAEQSADGGTEDEAEAERGADEAEVLGAVLRGGAVGNVGLRGGDVAAGEAVEEAGGEQDGEAAADAEQEITEAGAEQRYKKDGAAAGAVGPDAEQRAGKELGGGEGGGHEADGEGVAAVAADDVGDDGNEDADAEEIEEDGGEEKRERAARRSDRGRGAHSLVVMVTVWANGGFAEGGW